MKKKSDSRPTLSIITAVYNGVTTLEACINSVAQQSFTDWEYLIIDGGSGDGTLEILRDREDVIDCWLSEQDRGIYDALNKGISLARGKWLYFIGSDDLLYNSDVLQDVFRETCEVPMMYGNVLEEPGGAVYDGRFDQKKILRKNICQQAIFYRRELFERLGNFDLTYRLYADWYFNMLVFAEEQEPPKYLDMVIARYARQGASTHTIDMDFIKDRGKIVKRLFGKKLYLLYLLTCGIDQLHLKLRDLKRRHLT